MNQGPDFIVIDDDFGTNTYCKLMIKRSFPNAEIHTFTVPELGLVYLKSDYPASGNNLTVLLLDIDMPTMTGWDFLELFEELDENIKKKIGIYILTSSINPVDKQRASENPNIVGYINKPLYKDILNSIQDKYQIPGGLLPNN